VREALRRGHPCLGICLGMRLLFDASDEGPGAGIGLMSGRVTRLHSRRVPQIGWNALEEASDPRLTRAGIHTAWFANSFVCRPEDARSVVAWSTHESDRFPAVVRAGRTLGVQFHPEKSAAPGLALIAAFLAEVA
jgi:glutamine amidotransferase